MPRSTWSLLLVMLFLVPRPGWGQEHAPPVADLHLAVFQGDVEAVRQHAAAGTPLDAKDAYGSTPLTIATTFGQTDVALVLIEAGADLSVANNEGSTPLHVAALFGRTAIAEALLAAGADPQARNADGATAFDIAAAPFADDVALYDQLVQGLAPLGLALDYDRIEQARIGIAERLHPEQQVLSMVDYAPQSGSVWPVSTPAAQGLDPLLVAELYHDAAALETLHSLLVLKNGTLIAERYFHDGAVARKARLQSVTKSFTSALVGIALAEGCLASVDEPMMAYFPELADRVDDPRKEQITIRHLLQMRAGYPWEESTPALFEMLYAGFRPSQLVEVPLARDPGSAFDYSNLSSHLLGIIVARACNTDLRTFAQDHLFGPLAIEPGLWIQDWDGYYNGHADLHLTARAMAALGQLYLDDGVYAGTQVVPAAWVEASWQRYSRGVSSAGIQEGRVGRYFRDVGYGYQWWLAQVGERPFNLAWGHGGQFIIVLDDLDLVLVVTADPQVGKHDDKAWRHERSLLNLVGKFIQSLPPPSE